MDESRLTETVAPVGPSSPTIRIFAAGSEIGSRYEVRRVLGTGGSAVVYAVFDRALKREVALKVLRSDRLSEVSLKRFRREAAVARDAQSPRLVRVFDIGEAGEAVFLTMELVEGESLRARLERTRLSVDEAIQIGSEVLEALEVLHRLGVVHRDVKPGNVLLTQDGGVKLTDFGLARHWEGEESRATETEGLVGTIDYLAPEQALGQDVDARTDLYSVGVVLFELLAGETPLRGGSKLGTIVAHLRQKAPDVRTRRPDTPPWLAAFVARLLEKDPSRRYATAAEAVADLRAGRVRRRRVRWRSRVGAGLVAAFAVLVAAWVLRPQTVPLTLESEGRNLRAVDPRGRTLWRRELASPVQATRRADLDGDGRDEIIVSAYVSTEHVDRRSTPDPSEIAVFTAGGQVLTQVRLDDLVTTWAHPFRKELVPFLSVMDLDGDGEKEIVVVYLHRAFYPSGVVVYSSRRGGWDWVLDHAGRVFDTSTVPGSPDRLAFLAVNNRIGMLPVLGELQLSRASIGPHLATPGAMVTAGLTLGTRNDFAARWLAYVPLPLTPGWESTAGPPHVAATAGGDLSTVGGYGAYTLDSYRNPKPGPNAGRDLRALRLAFFGEALPEVKAFGGGGLAVRAELDTLRRRFSPLLAEPPYRMLLALSYGRRLLEAGDGAGAIEVLREASMSSPHEDVDIALAQALALQNRVGEGREILRRIASAPRPATAHGLFDAPLLLLHLAVVDHDAGEVTNAIRVLVSRSDLDVTQPGFSAVLRARARLLWDAVEENDMRVRSTLYAPEGDAVAALARWRLGWLAPGRAGAGETARATVAMRQLALQSPDAGREADLARAAVQIAAGLPRDAIDTLEERLPELEEAGCCDLVASVLLDLGRSLRALALRDAGERDAASAQAGAVLRTTRAELLPAILAREVLASLGPKPERDSRSRSAAERPGAR